MSIFALRGWGAEGGTDDLDARDEEGSRGEGFELNGEVGRAVGKSRPGKGKKMGYTK
jgi:hypothetical protein